MNDEILSPPFPGDGATGHVLFNLLKDLWKWVDIHRDDINEAMSKEVVPELEPFPKENKGYLCQAIVTQWTHFLIMRRIREAWDDVVRNHEDAWDSRLCVGQRAMLFQGAALLLNDAFIPYERREASRHRNMNRMQKMYERICNEIRTNLDPKYDSKKKHRRGYKQEEEDEEDA